MYDVLLLNSALIDGVWWSWCLVQVAAFQNERVEVVSNDYGNRTTPSLVVYDAACQEFLVGEPAVAKAHKLQPTPDAAAVLTSAKVSQLQISKLKTDAEAFIGQV